MASIKHLSGRKYRVYLFDGSWPNGKKRVKSKTLTVPQEIKTRRIKTWVTEQAIAMEAEFQRRGQGKYEFENPTFNEYALDWIERTISIKPSTKVGYRQSLSILYEFLGDIPLSSIRPVDIERTVECLQKRRKRRGTGYISTNTVLRHIQCASAVLKDATKNHYIDSNPVVNSSLPQEIRSKILIPDETQTIQLLSKINDEPLIYRCYYQLVFLTAARRGEICALKWADISEDAIHICRNLVFIAGTGITEGTPKNGKGRMIGVTPQIRELLNDLKSYHKEMFGEVLMDDYIFEDKEHHPLSPELMTHHFERLIKKAGLPRFIHLHTLRHCAITIMLENGASKQVVAEIAGHYSTDFLEATYCHPRMGAKIEAAQCLSDIVQSNNK